MVTKEQAMRADHFHFGDCTKVDGPRGGAKTKVENWRRNGRTQTWARSPERFRVPIKYGLRGYSEINERNATRFHVAEHCPIKRKFLALSPNFYGFGESEEEAKRNLKKSGGVVRICGVYQVPQDYWIDDFGNGHSNIGPGEFVGGTDHRGVKQ